MGDGTKKAAAAGGNGKDNGANPFAVGVRLDRAKRELHVSATRAVAGVSVASFCGLLIGVVALSRNASDNGPQSARASAVTTGRPVSIIPPEDQPPKVEPTRREPSKPAAVVPSPKPVTAGPTTPPSKAPVTVAAGPVRLDKSEDVSPIALRTPRPMPTTSIAPPTVDGAGAKEERVGQTYLVMGSYRTLKEAQTAVTKLRAKGVECTVEQSLPGYTRKGWYSVMSARGFKSTQDKAYQRELRALEEKGLEPATYRWRAASGA